MDPQLETSDTVCQVAVPVPLPGAFDYLWPFDVPPLPGMRVEIPFGKRRLKGVVVGCEASRTDLSRLKPVSSFWPEPALDADQLKLAHWCSRYYHHPLGEVLATMVTPGWEQPAPAPKQMVISETGQVALAADQVRGRKQLLALSLLATSPLTRSQLASESVSSAVLRGLLEAGRIIEQDQPLNAAVSSSPTLTADQADCVARVKSQPGFGVHLLQGVTGSGKTEVYLDLMSEVLAQGRQTLVMVPEIGLTPQLERRFRQRLGGAVVLLHSGLSDGERSRGWHLAASGEAKVVVGTRSAVFCPLVSPGLLVVDEEHDLSLKQHEGFRYSARDVAVQRARQLDVPIILGSATPSLETLNNAWTGRYQHLILSQRPGSVTMPSVELVDSRGGGSGEALTPQARQALREVLDREEQALVFLNRRGFAPTLLCDACGWVAECPRCDSRLTLHQRHRQLRCHHCGVTQRAPNACGECHSTRLAALGLGTQRVEQMVSEAFPQTKLWRVDRDSARSRKRLLALLADIGSGDSGVLVGTQMLAKGHDFPNVTLVVVVNIDHALFSSDFRAAERAAQLLVQVAGRAGRAEKPGRVLVQTHQPDHPMFHRVLSDGYPAFARDLLAERRAAGYPPVGNMALLRAHSHELSLVQGFMGAAIGKVPSTRGVEFLGPLPSPMERRAGRYHMQILLSAVERQPLHQVLNHWLPLVSALPAARRVRWSIDVDPQDLF
ncbi:MAG: primosomal protein N' [Lysobacterales bacterium]